MTEFLGNIRRTTHGYRVVYELHELGSRTDVWHAIHDRAQLAAWLGVVSHDLNADTTFTVSYLNDADYRITGTVQRCSPMRTLVFDWHFNNDAPVTVHFDIVPALGQRVGLRLEVSGLDEQDVVVAAATWHAQLEFLRAHLQRIPAPAYALRFRRDELEPAYAAQVRALGADAPDEPAAPVSDRRNEFTTVLHTHAYLA